MTWEPRSGIFLGNWYVLRLLLPLSAMLILYKFVVFIYTCILILLNIILQAIIYCFFAVETFQIITQGNNNRKLWVWLIGTGFVLYLRPNLIPSSTEEKEAKSRQQYIIGRKMIGVCCSLGSQEAEIRVGEMQRHTLLEQGPQDIHLFMRPYLLKFLPLLNNTNKLIWHPLAFGRSAYGCCLTRHQNLPNKTRL